MKKQRSEVGGQRSARLWAAVGLALWAGSAWAGWSTNWPAWQFPSAGVYHAQDCYSAVVERCQAAGVAAPSTNVFFDAQYANLVELKAKVKALVPYYVATNQANAAGNYTNWFTVGVNDFPMLTVTGLCAQLKIPTNYFDFTPYDGLCGLGGFEDDAGVGHPRGWTNSSTVAGGSVYPDGRSNAWFTTDYGWGELRSVVGSLLYTTSSVCLSMTNAMAGYSSLHLWTSPWTYDWSYHKTEAESRFASEASSVMRRGTWGGWGHYTMRNTSYLAGLWSSAFTLGVSNVSTAASYTVQWYGKGGYISHTYWGVYTHADTFDSMGLNLALDQFTLLDSSAEGNSAYVWSTSFGQTNMPSPWCSEPNTSQNNETTRGVELSGRKAVLMWGGANGFQYK